MLCEALNGHVQLSRYGDWTLTDSYTIDGFIHLYMCHPTSKRLVPLAKLETHFNREQVSQSAGYYRIDLDPRFSPDGRSVSIDSSHEGLGRQIDLLDNGHFPDNPPSPSG